jgi:hypothetical protein
MEGFKVIGSRFGNESASRGAQPFYLTTLKMQVELHITGNNDGEKILIVDKVLSHALQIYEPARDTFSQRALTAATVQFQTMFNHRKTCCTCVR